MGIFSTKTKVYVASTAYNLAGDEDLRPNFLRSTLLSAVLTGGKTSLGETLRLSLSNGPAGMQRRFFYWARDNYVFGLPTASLGIDLPVAADQAQAGLLPLLGLGSNQSLRVLAAVVDDADIHYWAESWLELNHPGTPDANWAAEWDAATSEIVVFLLGTETTRLAAPADLLWGATQEGRKLLYVSYRITTKDEETLLVTEGPTQLFTYRMGTGNVVFDALALARDPMTEFFPALPMRLSGLSIRDPSYSAEYPSVTKGYRRLTGANIEDLLDSIEANEDIGDVDSVFLVQGVSLNTKEDVGRAYIYKFLRSLLEWQHPHEAEVPVLGTSADAAEISDAAAWARWFRANATGNTSSPVYGTEVPAGTPTLQQAAPAYELQVRSEDLTKADFRVRWADMAETLHVGNAKTFDGDLTRGKAKVGQYWFHVGEPVVRKIPLVNLEERRSIRWQEDTFPRVYLFHQYSKYHYKKLTCIGLEYRNYVYEKHAVIITAQEALEDPDESGFVVPLHMPTLKSLGSAKASQLVTSSTYLVFNSYKIVKQRWYQRGIFKIIIAIAAIAFSAVTAGAGFGAAVGIFGTNLSVGLALGASASMAALVGAVANSIAAMVVTTLISKASTVIFGDKLGAIIGTIASFVAFSYAGQFAAHGNFDVNWTQLLQPNKLLDLTNSVTGAYAKWLAADTASIYEETLALGEEHAEAMKEIEELSKEILGMTAGEIDPMMFVDATEYFGESSEAFLNRTLLTGSDLMNISRAMIENFVDISLELPKAVPSPYA